MLTGGSRTPAEDVSARPGLFLRAKFLFRRSPGPLRSLVFQLLNGLAPS